ncbi:hypothetical protein ILYODFUR_022890 [Ilyodon furcidens]|uniref:Uncharacterized protein n=1 Tax=Ilyodon furcidens TaxID=33524 RepID=A0ABV0TYL2_9TELE
MDEYQLWCEEASATIARVGKFSLECRSTEAVSVLYRQFEKFVWPTVPQQEERISQITELAIRLHGVEEGQRYIEKTVSKHSEMVESIRELSNGLMELEAKLKRATEWEVHLLLHPHHLLTCGCQTTGPSRPQPITDCRYRASGHTLSVYHWSITP